MKFPKLFGRKKSDEDEDDFDPEDVDEADAVDGKNPHADIDEEMTVGGAAGEDDDDEYEEYDEEDEELGGSRRKALLFAGLGAIVVLLSAVGGVGWWYFSGDHGAAPKIAEKAPPPGRAAKQADGSIAMSMPSKSGTRNASGGMSLNQMAGGAEAPARTAEAAQPEQAAPPEPAAKPVEESETPTVLPVATNTPVNMNSMNNLNASQSPGGGMVMPAVGSSMLASIPDHASAADQKQSLSKAPVKGLLEDKDGVKGQLPKIGDKGAQPWQAYARPADPNVTGPKIAILIEYIGLSRAASLGAINKLPPAVTMVLSPYGNDLKDWLFRSRLAGHEVFIGLPMESDNFPMEDPGPLSLDTRIQVAENSKRMDMVLASVGGYVGVVTMMGSKFLKAEGQLRKVLQPLKVRGLMFVVGGAKKRNDAFSIAAELGLPRAESEVYIDEEPRIGPIRQTLDRLESVARDRGYAIGTARPYPVTIKTILEWEKTLAEKKVSLVPVSSIAQGVNPK